MHLLDPTPEAIDRQLSKTITETPELFRNMPIVIDLQKLDDWPEAIDFAELNAPLREYGLIPVGVSNGSEKLQQAARMAGLGSLSGVKKASSAAKKTPPKAQAESFEPSMIIKQPVRSGQRIYAKGADLIVQASVSNGAEIIADGNIHIYGNLRGRAIAGAQGNKNARIFCQSLQAELVSIAGNYRLNDSLNIDPASGPFVIWLDEEQLTIDRM